LDFLEAVGGESADFPTIILTGAADDGVDRAAMDSGATDYLCKSNVTPELIQRSLRYAVKQFHSRKQLEDARRLAEVAAEAKSQFLATMSHEIRTPMNGVIGILNLLQNDVLTDEQMAQVHMAAQSAQHLVAVINDILDLSKLEANSVELTDQPTRVTDLVEGVIALLLPNAAMKGLALTQSIDPDVPEWVSLDPFRVHQVLVNLVENAIKFSDQGSVHVRLAVSGIEGEELLSFSVADCGKGVPENLKLQLFERFFQIDSTLTREAGGAGLGLTICKQYVQLMGGDIGVEDGPEEGSCFWFRLPAIRVETPHNAKPEDRPTSEAERTTPLNVLVVEDNETNRYIVQAILAASGDKVTVALDGAEAVARVKEASYDVILMDIQMPVMDGIAATEAIRALNVHTPIIALTANAMAGDREHYLASGMNDYVSKPVDPNVLWDAISRSVA